MLAGGAVLWGVMLLLPTHIFPTAAQLAAGTGRTTYALMALIAPEWLWGWLFLIQGAIAGYTVLYTVRNRVTLVTDAFLGCVLWTASTLACFAAYWPKNLPFWAALGAYVPPAAMGMEIVAAAASCLHLIRYWAVEERNGH